MSESIPARRMRLVEQAPKPYAAVYGLKQSIEPDRGMRLLIEEVLS